jgi:hypothetical protein
VQRAKRGAPGVLRHLALQRQGQGHVHYTPVVVGGGGQG